MTHFVYMNTQKYWFKKKATFVRSRKVEMISTFQRNRHFRKVSVNKTFTHVQDQKKRCRRDIPLIFHLVENRLKRLETLRWPDLVDSASIEL